MNPTENISDEYNAWDGDENNSWTKRATTVEELWKDIGRLAFTLGYKSRFVWRGMSSAKYLVTSTLYRALQTTKTTPTEEDHQFHEARMLQKAREWGLGHTQYGQSTDLQLLAELQHHGFPTRLIDVTVNPMTALWFACAQNPDEPGRLVAIALPDIAEVETSPTIVTAPTWDDMGNPLAAKYHQQLRHSQAQKVPFLVRPTVRDARMNAQEGLFITASVPTGEEDTPLPSLPIPTGNHINLWSRLASFDRGIQFQPDSGWGHYSVLGLEISPEMKQQLLPVLENTFNRSARTLYPDMDGFVRTQTSQFLKDLQENTPN